MSSGLICPAWQKAPPSPKRRGTNDLKTRLKKENQKKKITLLSEPKVIAAGNINNVPQIEFCLRSTSGSPLERLVRERRGGGGWRGGGGGWISVPFVSGTQPQSFMRSPDLASFHTFHTQAQSGAEKVIL